MGNLKQVPVCGEICQQFSSLHNFKTKPNNGYIDDLCLMKGLGACFTIDNDTGWLLGFETFFPLTSLYLTVETVPDICVR